MTGFFETLIDQLREPLRDERIRHRNLPLLKGAMAASALAAIADGSITFSQRVRVDQVLQTLEALKVFNPNEGVDLFNHYTEAILKSPRNGRKKALKAIKKVAKDQKTAALLIRICRAISEAHGDPTLVEKIEMISLCSQLGVDPKVCGLNVNELGLALD